jgi:sialate O-acetylesterase
MKVLILAGVAVAALSSMVMGAAIELPAIISENMVLQRSAKTPIWGKAGAGEKVSVTFANVAADTVADGEGKWRVDLDLEKAPEEPGELVIAAAEKVTIKNVIVGEVWLCSGQSNMEWPLAETENASAEIAAASFPKLRHFTVARKVSNEPLPFTGHSGAWVVATPETAARFTAVGYYFGREIHQKTGKPVGLIHSAWGGTNAESWTSDAQLLTVERYRDSVARRKASYQNPGEALAKFRADTIAWEKANLPPEEDAASVTKNWAGADVNATDWHAMDIPQFWQRAGLKHNGIVWFRKKFDVPAEAAGKPATLSLGGIDDFDITYVNGQRVGVTGSEVEDFWKHPRNYQVPAGLLKAGTNVIAVRVTDIRGDGGFGGPVQAMHLDIDDQSINLAGPWSYKVEHVIDFTKLPKPPEQAATNDPNQPAVLYNGMIAPIVPYGLRGAIWYQGESNAWRHDHYTELMTLLIEGWRKDFDRGAFPFYIVQLANFMARADQPTDTQWAKLRDAQRRIAQTVPNTGLAVTIDIGDEVDIHPRNKRDVGKRLAAIALAKDYGQQVEYSGPLYDSHVIEGDRVRVKFIHADGLTTGGAKPLGFAIAGEDGKFVWADAVIEGDMVVLSAAGVSKPVAVQYAWADNPEVNLKNAAGFPAVPFKMAK